MDVSLVGSSTQLLSRWFCQANRWFHCNAWHLPWHWRSSSNLWFV